MKKSILIIIALTFSLKNFAQHSEYELQYINEVNLLRTNPKLYADFVRTFISNRAIDSLSKSIAIKEVIPLLDTMKSLTAYLVSEEIRLRLNEFKGIDSVSKTLFHENNFMENSDWKHWGQNLVMSPISIPRMGIITLLIDRSFLDRSHRNSLLSTKYTNTAVRRVVFGNENNPFQGRIWWIQQFANN
jgi:hypothetical protein